MANLNDVIKLTAEQYNTLINGGTISGHTYDENSIYLIEDSDTMTLLWENPNPTSTFASQTISLSESYNNYQYLIIEYALWNSYPTREVKILENRFYGTTTQSAGETFTVLSNYTNWGGSSGSSYSRYISMPSTIDSERKQLLIQNGYDSGAGTTAQNGVLVPVKIYGANSLNTVPLPSKDNLTILWENPNPNTSWTNTSAQSLNGSLNDFRYIIFEWKPYSASNYLRETTIYKNPNYGTSTVPSSNATYCYLSKMTQSSSTTHMCRTVVSSGSANSIIFQSAYKNTTIDNSSIIPTAIYGTNNLSTTSNDNDDIPTLVRYVNATDNVPTGVHMMQFTSNSGGGSLNVPNCDYIISVMWFDQNNNWVYGTPENHSFYVTNYDALYYYKLESAPGVQIRLVYKTK